MGYNKKVLRAIDRELKDRHRSKRYSKSLSATNSLFAPNYLFSKPSKRRIYNPNAKYFKHGGPGPHDPPNYYNTLGKNLTVEKSDPNYKYKDYAKRYNVDIDNLSLEDIESLMTNQQEVEDYWKNQTEYNRTSHPTYWDSRATKESGNPAKFNEYAKKLSKYHTIPGDIKSLGSIGWEDIAYEGDPNQRREDYPVNLQNFIIDNTTDNVSYVPQLDTTHGTIGGKIDYSQFPLVRIDDRFPNILGKSYYQKDEDCMFCPDVSIPQYDTKMLERLWQQKVLDDFSYEEVWGDEGPPEETVRVGRNKKVKLRGPGTYPWSGRNKSSRKKKQKRCNPKDPKCNQYKQRADNRLKHGGPNHPLPIEYLKSHGERDDEGNYQMKGFEKAVNADLTALLRGFNTDGYDSHWYEGDANNVNYGVTSDQLRVFASENHPKSFVNAAAYSHAMNKLANDAGGKNVINIPFADNAMVMRTDADDLPVKEEYVAPQTLQEQGYINETGTNAVNQDKSYTTGLAKRYTEFKYGGAPNEEDPPIKSIFDPRYKKYFKIANDNYIIRQLLKEYDKNWNSSRTGIRDNTLNPDSLVLKKDHSSLVKDLKKYTGDDLWIEGIRYKILNTRKGIIKQYDTAKFNPTPNPYTIELDDLPWGENRTKEDEYRKWVVENYPEKAKEWDINNKAPSKLNTKLIRSVFYELGPMPDPIQPPAPPVYEKEDIEPEVEIEKLDVIQPELISNDVELPELEEREEVEGVDYKRKFGMWLEDKAQKDAKLKTFFKYTVPEFLNPKKSHWPQYSRTPKRLRAGFYNKPIENELEYPEGFVPMFSHGGPHDPPKVKQRKGVRENPDGTVSSHLMRAEYIPERGWVAFPSLFQDDDGTWVDMSEEENWEKILDEANKRSEVYEFGDDKFGALAFGMGSWKPENQNYNLKRALELGYEPDETGHWPSVDDQTGMFLKSMDHPTAFKEYMYGQLNKDIGTNSRVVVNPEGPFGDKQLQYVELTDEEAEEYRSGGYIVEEMHEGGEPGHTHDGDPPEKKSKDQQFRERWNLEMKQNQDIDNTFHIVNQRPLIGLDGVDPDAEYNAWIDQNIDYGTNPNKSWITSAYEGIMGIPELLTETIPNYIAETAEDAYDQFSKTSIVPSNINEGLDDLYHLPANLLAKDYSSYSTRDKAFAQARADGETSFMYKGKRFNTRREDDDIKLTFETDDPDEQYVFQHLTDETKKEYPILWNLMNKASGIDEISFDGVGSRWISQFDEKSLQDKNRGYFDEGMGLGDGASIHVGKNPFESDTYDRFINVLIAELAHRTGHEASNNPVHDVMDNFKTVYERIKYGDEKRYQTPGTEEFNTHRLTEPGIHMMVRGQMTPAIVKKVQNFLGVEEDGIFGEDTYLTMVDRFKDNELIKQMLEGYAKGNPKDKHPELPISFGEEALWATYLNVLSAHVPELSKSTGSWKPYTETVQNMGDEFIIPFTKESFKDRKITDFNIRELQSFLAQQGYELPNSVVYVHERYGTLYDGILGDETKTAFKNYRKKLGYKKQGGSVGLGDLVDKATMQRLKKQGYTFQEI